MAFYKLLLRGQRTAPYLGNRAYVVKWNQTGNTKKKDLLPIGDGDGDPAVEDGDEHFYGAVVVPPRAPKRTRPSAGRGRGRGGGAGLGRGAGGHGDVVHPPITDNPDTSGGAAARGHGGDGGDSGHGGAASSGGGPGGGGEEDFFPDPEPIVAAEQEPGINIDGIGGVTLRFQDYKNTTTGRREPNWTTKCYVAGHGACGKRRGCCHEKKYGNIEPVAFLHCWRDVNWPTNPKVPTHAKETPTPGAVARFIEEHREELEAIVRKAGR